MSNTNSIDNFSKHVFVFYVKGERHHLLATHDAVKETVDVTLNKANYFKTGVPFSETRSLFPVTLSDEVSGIKATVDFDEELGEKGEFVFDINGEPFENHLYVENYALDDTKVYTY